MKSAHLLAAFLVLLLVLDQLLIGRLKKASEPRPRIRIYALVMAGHWLATIWAAAVMGVPRLWRISLASTTVNWLPGGVGIVAIVLISLSVMGAPAVLARMPSKAAAVQRAAAKLAYVLPQNLRERMWWIVLSITAGVCEECLFRSFLFWYLQSPPWHLGFAAAMVIACVLFALGHLYQGVLPAVGTGLLAFLFFVFFLATGSLLLPVVMHTLADLRVLLLIAHVRPRSAPATLA